jgi:Spy/CpxP family protein refolding chaperone
MKRTVSLSILLMAVTLLMMLLSVTLVFAQSSPATQTTEGYNEVIIKRAAKIVAALHTTDTVFNKKVTAIVADQYIQLGRIHDGRNTQIKEIKSKGTELTADDKAAIQKLEADADQQLAKLHTTYLAKLSALCTPQQIDAIKDGMTFNVLNVTYTAYQDMLLNLTDDQKKQILTWLTEAREKAMDAESAEKKHAWFGKYKGRINNYLSAAGIDMKKEEAGWQQRIRERKEAAKQGK